MRSMTGYGRGSADAPEFGLRIEVEITSVNRKTLDAHISSPREWTGIDQQCNDWLKGVFQRGRLNIQIKVESTEGTMNGLTWNTLSMDATIERLRNYADSRNIPFNLDASSVIELAKSLKDSVSLPDWKEILEPIREAFHLALTDIDAMRLKEGHSLAIDLTKRLDEMRRITDDIEHHAKNTVGSYKDALLDRLSQLGLDLDVSDERVLKEVAIFADRSDISEECTRLRSHFDQFLGFIQSDQACGRKMDFLCQEIHREFNTTGSKSSPIEITRAVIEGKNALERVREQVQNIE